MRTSLFFLAIVLATVGGPSAPPAKAEAPPKDTPARKDVALVVQSGHALPITAVAYSPDGRFVVTVSGDQSAKLWDAATGKELRAFIGHDRKLTAVAISPDGKQVLTASFDLTARLWDARTGKELRRFDGHGHVLTSVAFSPNGKQTLIGGQDKTARLWDAATGKELRQFEGHGDAVLAVAFAPDGKHVLTGSGDKTARLWDAATGAKAVVFEGHEKKVNAVAFSPDGKLVLTGSEDQTARLWDAQTGKERLVLRHEGAVRAVAFAPDGKRIASGDEDGMVRLWDAATAREVKAFKGTTGRRIWSVVFSPDGKYVLTSGGGPPVARLWDAKTGAAVRDFKGLATPAKSVAFTPDGKRLVVSSGVHAAQMWDAENSKALRTFEGHKALVLAVAVSPDGKQVLTGSDDETARLWDAKTGEAIHVLKGHTAKVTSVAFSPDGKRLATASFDKTARLWDAATGKELLTLTGHTRVVFGVAFSPDGRRVATASGDEMVKVWDAENGNEVLTLKGHTARVDAVTFSADGKHILTGAGHTGDNDTGELTRIDRTVRLWDAATGKELRKLTEHSVFVFSVAYSPDGKYVLTGAGENLARLVDAKTGETVREFKGHLGAVQQAVFSPNGKFVLTGSLRDQTARLWETATGKELCRLVTFEDGGWAVVDAAGRYDASNGGDVAGLHWVAGDETIALDQLKERYYDPGLLAKYLGLSDEPLREVAAFEDIKLFPEVALAQKDAAKPVLDVALTNRGGGIGKVVVLVNGKELTGDARPRGADANAPKLSVQLDLSNDPRLVPGQKNKVEVLAYNADGYLCSRGLSREIDDPGAASADPPQLYAIIAGVSKYRSTRLNLAYAAKDADDFAKALELAAGRMFEADKVHIKRLTGATEKDRPGRAALEKALTGLKETKPADLVVVYLAGHGTTYGGQDGDWHYLTADCASPDLSDPAVRKQASISSKELTEWLKAAPAQKQVLILDTCHSGRMIEKLTEKRDVPGSQVRAMERVKDRTGMFVLAGCAADSVSYEATKYGQGLLTYSLLLGMRGASLREGEYLDVAGLFNYAADKVPELARDIGGVQRPLIASPRGAPFDIGRLTREDQAKVPLQQVKPVVPRAVFQLEKPSRDTLKLSRRVNDRLREKSAVARGAKLVFVDADEFPGGVEVSGRYTVGGNKVTVTVELFEGEKALPTFKIEGIADNPDELADKVVAEVEKRLAAARR